MFRKLKSSKHAFDTVSDLKNVLDLFFIHKNTANRETEQPTTRRGRGRYYHRSQLPVT